MKTGKYKANDEKFMTQPSLIASNFPEAVDIILNNFAFK